MLSELRRELVVAHPPAGVADLPVLRHILQLDRVRHPAAEIAFGRWASIVLALLVRKGRGE